MGFMASAIERRMTDWGSSTLADDPPRFESQAAPISIGSGSCRTPHARPGRGFFRGGGDRHQLH